MNTPLPNPDSPTPSSAPSEDRAAWIWGGLVCGLLGACLVTQFSFFYIASSDPSAVAEADYYAKAVDWETRQRQEQLNRQLGWKGALEVSPLAEGRRVVTLTLTSAEGKPLSGCRVSAEVFHKARAGHPSRALFRPSPTPGVYVAELPLRRAGVWEVRLEAWLGDSPFTLRRDVIAPGP